MVVTLTDEEIRKMAKDRAGFKVHASVYLIVNLFLAAIWFFTTGRFGAADFWSYWPIWPHLGWGIGLALHGFGVYGGSESWEKREEERLRMKYGGGNLR